MGTRGIGAMAAWKKGTALNKDTLISILSDTHSGGSSALFPNRFWQFKHTNHTPTPKQRAMFEHFDKCAKYAGKARKNKRLIMVHDGDAIEGVHHGSIEAITFNRDEQCEVHVDLMDHFMKQARFSRKQGDRLFYVSGTESHVGDKEEGIAKDLCAEKTSNDTYVFDHLELEVNGRLVWFIHHGKARGKGANEGNALRNWLRDIFWECKKAGVRPPDLVVSGHTHTPAYGVYVVSDGDGYHMIHGIICPSWQQKTKFAKKVASVDRNQVGAAFVEIRADGEIRPPVILKQETEESKKVVI